MLLSRTLLLRSEPAGSLHSLEEMFALANAMEQEAADRYTELAEEMQRQGRGDLTKVFADLAAAEREHVDSVVKWSHARTGRAPDASMVRWQAPETFDADAVAEIESSRLMTPYRALSMAVRNEERAFAFWSYLAAYSDSADVKTASEAMAREELGHVAALRKERRRAYHLENEARRASLTVTPGGNATAGQLEHRLAGLLFEMAARRRGPQADRLRELAQDAEMMAADAADVMDLPAALAQSDAPVIAEALADAYLDYAERATEPDQLDLLQRLASQAIARLAWLRSLT
ncbi:ferritin family protein [Bradyrhizobium sp. SRS-191]|uniref:ferritin-like domain-containing protein n=1 Tax=Bradyrhizobium sp. SRS-191 TaxID=2962606 RepID=UPI00211E1379|nr:ferritin family protein [Bradyrhizobium sp. SRS-191]